MALGFTSNNSDKVCKLRDHYMGFGKPLDSGSLNSLPKSVNMDLFTLMQITPCFYIARERYSWPLLVHVDDIV